MFRHGCWLLLLASTAGAHAETIVLAAGGFVEGSLVRQTSRNIAVRTRFGLRTFTRDEVAQVLETPAPLDSDEGFSRLSATERTVLNARAEYELEQYDKALKRLSTLRKQDRPDAARLAADWLIIEIHERKGRWEKAKRLLREKVAGGTPQEQVRAQAHLDIFETNPSFDLRFVGEKHARTFMRDEALRSRAREPGALTERRIMEVALKQYCEHLLAEDRLSVKAFADSLEPARTTEACRKLPRTGDVGRFLPYMNDLKRAEVALSKTYAILGDYGEAFELDLARVELNHLLIVRDRLLSEVFATSPEHFDPPFDRGTGLLTNAGRDEWRRRCDAFLELALPVSRLIDYMVEKVTQYPQGLRDLHRELVARREHFNETIKAVRKARSRTRA